MNAELLLGIGHHWSSPGGYYTCIRPNAAATLVRPLYTIPITLTLQFGNYTSFIATRDSKCCGSTPDYVMLIQLWKIIPNERSAILIYHIADIRSSYNHALSRQYDMLSLKFNVFIDRRIQRPVSRFGGCGWISLGTLSENGREISEALHQATGQEQLPHVRVSRVDWLNQPC